MAEDSAVPTLYGIDPDIRYAWVPGEFLGLPVQWEARCREIDSKYDLENLNDTTRKEHETEYRELVRELKDEPRLVQEGSPVFYLKPLSDKLSIRLQQAQAEYQQKREYALKRFRDALLRAESIENEDKRRETIRELEESATEHNIERGISIFTPELISSVLSDSLDGWDNIVKAWQGKWPVDSRVIKPEWKHEMFFAIRDGSVWSDKIARGFISRQHSQVN